MTNRERFIKPLNFDMNIDRFPAIEWTPLWNETVKRWRNEGLDGNVPDGGIKSYFGVDDILKHIVVWPRRENFPDLPYGHGCVNSMEDYKRMMRYIYPEDIVEKNEEVYKVAKQNQFLGEYAVGIIFYGFFWWSRELFGMENFLYAIYDYPDLIHKINSDLLKFNIAKAEEIFKIIKPDYFIISEDMCYKHGPLISYDLFRNFMLPYYLELIPVIKRYGALIFMDTDGQFEYMIPWIIEAKLDGSAPCERNAGVDPARIRKEYPGFLMIGGFDKTIMYKGEARMREEFEYLLPVMRSGGFIPSCDHQVPPDVSLSDYRLYIKLLKEYCRKAVNTLKYEE